MATGEKILIVDDDRTVGKTMELQLTSMGYSVVGLASNAPDALLQLERSDPDLVLMDINLGKGRDGVELAQDIAREHRIPVIYVTAYADEKTLARAKKTLPFGYINKPVRLTDLRTTVALALEQAASRVLREGAAQPDFWKLRCLWRPNGEFILDSEGEAALKKAGHAAVQDILPRNHQEQLDTCLREKRPLLCSGRCGERVYSWEYRPSSRGASVQLTVTDVTEHAELVSENLQNASLSEAFDRLAAGVIFVNENLKVFYTNKSAARIIADSPNLQIKNGFLRCGQPAATAELQRRVLFESGTTLSLKRGGELPPLHVLVSPFNTREENYGNDLPIAIVYLFEVLKEVGRMEEVIRTLYNLSPAEAKIAARLVLNPHVEEIAKDMGITYNTARTHLKRIYAKMRINRLSSLIHMIVTGPAGVLLHTAQGDANREATASSD